jgi:hypothetical protein
VKIIKNDGTIEEGIGITDEQAAEMQRIEETLHVVICQNGYHYDWQGIPKCRKVANAVALGHSLLEALEDLKPKPVTVVVPEMVVEPEAIQPAVAEKEELPL